MEKDSINELKKLLEKQQEELFRLKKIISLIPGHIYWLDKNNVYQGCNLEQAENAGLKSPAEIIGKTNRDFPWKERADQIDAVNNQVMEYGKALVVEEPAKMVSGERVFLSKKVPLRDEGGNIYGILGASLDITERKQMEEKLAAAKASEAMNKVTQAFLENMGHDLRTALTGIEGNAQLIHDVAKNKELKEYAKNLLLSCRVLTFIHNQILNATRVFSGNIPLYKKKFNLQAKLKQIVDLNLSKAYAKKLKLSLVHDELIPCYLIGDSKRLSTIALELISNALKYTEKGEVRIETHLYKQEGQNLFIKLVVSDTGIGISEEQQEAIFMRFNRLTPSYEGKYKGLGLGLSVVKQFVDELKGEIYVKSKENKGTRFTCYFPLQQAIESDDENLDNNIDLFDDMLLEEFEPIVSQSVVDQKKGGLGKSHILVVEDQPIAAQVANGILSNLNCSVELAQNGEEALEKAFANTYDLIFMDVGLPDMDGNIVTRYIREKERATNTYVPIVALTAHVNSEHKQRCIEAGMDAVLNKPLVKEKAEDILDVLIPTRSKNIAETIDNEAGDKQHGSLFNLDSEVIDLTKGAELVGADETMAKKMIHMMLKNFEEEKFVLNEAHQAKNWDIVSKIVHKLRGGIAYCGTPRLYQAVSYLEDYIKAKKTDLVEKLYQQFLGEIEKVRSEKSKFC